jgi:hypothetical protein
MGEPTEDQKTKARRAQAALYWVMGILILGPLILYWIFGRK